MSLKEFNVKIRRALEEAYLKGNVDALDVVYGSDGVFHEFPFPDLKGLEAFEQFILQFCQTFTGTGNTLVARFTTRMKHTGVLPMRSRPDRPTGNVFPS